jgi:hypothetical protein
MSAIIVGFCDDVAYGAYRNKKDNQRKQVARSEGKNIKVVRGNAKLGTFADLLLKK